MMPSRYPIRIRRHALARGCLLLLGLIVTSPLCLGEDKDAVVKEEAAKNKPPAAEQAAEPKPPQPRPVGKLGIRKGTGRPAGKQVAAEAIMADTAVEVVPELGLPVGQPKPAADPALEAEVERLRKQLLELLRPQLHAELYFVHLVCGTNAQERQRLKAAIEPELERTALAAARHSLTAAQAGRQGVVGFVQVRQGNRVVMVRGGGAATADEPVERLRKSLMRLAREQLGEQRTVELERELKQRLDAQRRTTVVDLVDQLDKFLILSPQQQQEIGDHLLAGWRDEWQLIPQNLPSNYLPDMTLPPSVLRSFTAEQKKYRHAVPKATFSNQQNRPLQLPPPQRVDRWLQALEQLDQAELEANRSP